MPEPRLKAELWVKAQIRQCFARDIPAFVVRRGDAHAGTVLIKLNRFDAGVQVFAPIAAMEGGRAWLCITGESAVDDSAADLAISKRTRNDPDIWVLEIEDRDGIWELDAPLA